jgi:hypothetical protein
MKKLLCLIFGHKPARQFFDDEKGDIVTACPRCMTILREPDLVYPEEMPLMAPGVAQGPLTEPAAGDVVCTVCGYAWHSHHPLSGPVLCSVCLIKKDIGLLEARIRELSMTRPFDAADEIRRLSLMRDAQTEALKQLQKDSHHAEN